MLFRPSFCANCGEKVERSDWGLFTSRRFCAVCESELKAHDLVPRAVVGLGVLIGIFGIGSYLKNGNAETKLSKLASQPIERPAPAAQRDFPAGVVVPTPAQTQAPPASNALSPTKTASAVPPATQVAKSSASDAVYMCGAMTKKGTPCTRRVHGPGRCFQHQGMPAMLPEDKLKIG